MKLCLSDRRYGKTYEAELANEKVRGEGKTVLVLSQEGLLKKKENKKLNDEAEKGEPI